MAFSEGKRDVPPEIPTRKDPEKTPPIKDPTFPNKDVPID